MPQKIYAHFSHFNIKKFIAQTNKSYTSLDFLAHKENGNLCLMFVNETKVIGAYSRCSRNETFHRDFFVEIDFVSGNAETKLFFGRQW